jgi:hypothetical protein
MRMQAMFSPSSAYTSAWVQPAFLSSRYRFWAISGGAWRSFCRALLSVLRRDSARFWRGSVSGLTFLIACPACKCTYGSPCFRRKPSEQASFSSERGFRRPREAASAARTSRRAEPSEGTRRAAFERASAGRLLHGRLLLWRERAKAAERGEAREPEGRHCGQASAERRGGAAQGFGIGDCRRTMAHFGGIAALRSWRDYTRWRAARLPALPAFLLPCCLGGLRSLLGSVFRRCACFSFLSDVGWAGLGAFYGSVGGWAGVFFRRVAEHEGNREGHEGRAREPRPRGVGGWLSERASAGRVVGVTHAGCHRASERESARARSGASERGA